MITKNSKRGYTLIELLVVIGILSVLLIFAIPAVAGLGAKTNVVSDDANALEMTNAFERFAAEYELYKQDLASRAFDVSSMDSVQSRVFNVIGATTSGKIDRLESMV